MITSNRIALNTFIQYIQLFIQVLCGLITVRFVLNALGPSDYGIYDVIGGIVAMMGFITSSLSQTSMRFISVSLGKNDLSITKRTFKSCLYVHVIISLVFSIALELIGLYLFNNNINIPADRISVAHFIYRCMIISLFFNIISTPFLALIFSHEHFFYTTLIGILEAILKLTIAIAISNVESDRLWLYGLLMAIVSLSSATLYMSYSIFKYRSMISIGKPKYIELKEIIGFAGWTLLDVFGISATRQGYSILITQFFGPSTNASFALARQISGPIDTIGASVVNTIKPQLMISKGSGDEQRMFRLSLSAGKFSVSLTSLIIIPLMITMPEALSLWLKVVPQDTVLFTRLILGTILLDQMTKGLVYANQAEGNIKWFSIIVSSIRFMALPVSLVLFINNYPVHYAVIVFLVFEGLSSLSKVLILSKISSFKIYLFLESVFLRIIPLLIISAFVCVLLYHYLNGIWGLIFITLINSLVYISLLYLFGLTKEEKFSTQTLINSLFKLILLK